jgi:hypothetical protein
MTPEELQSISEELSNTLTPILEKNNVAVVMIVASPIDEMQGMKTYNSTPELSLHILECAVERIESQLQDIAENN